MPETRIMSPLVTSPRRRASCSIWAASGLSAGLEFWGSSFICDPFGVMLAEASTDREETLLAEIDLTRIEDVRRNWPFLRDRRIDAYTEITNRFLDEDPWQKK